MYICAHAFIAEHAQTCLNIEYFKQILYLLRKYSDDLGCKGGMGKDRSILSERLLYGGLAKEWGKKY